MKILMINKFLYPKGGDAICTLRTGQLLMSKGHHVSYWGMGHRENPRYAYDSYFMPYADYYGHLGISDRIRMSANILYSFEAMQRLDKRMKIDKPDIVHLNNIAHQLSPSILNVISSHNIPSVMTMHDYKLVCPTYRLLSRNKPCRSCINGRYYNCLFKRCTKDSLLKSLLNTVEMYLHHSILHIYNKINVFIAPSRFIMRIMRDMGFRNEMVYLPNFINLKSYKPNYMYEERSVAYIGRLSQEKGIVTLIRAMKNINATLKIIGDGPMRNTLQLLADEEEIRNVNFLGYKTGDELEKEIKAALFLVVPSEWYENNPLSIIEAFAFGKPVIGSRIGGIPELVLDDETGYTFEPGNASDLRRKIMRLLDSREAIIRMGNNARNLVKEYNNPQKYYGDLMSIYKKAHEMNRF